MPDNEFECDSKMPNKPGEMSIAGGRASENVKRINHPSSKGLPTYVYESSEMPENGAAERCPGSDVHIWLPINDARFRKPGMLVVDFNGSADNEKMPVYNGRQRAVIAEEPLSGKDMIRLTVSSADAERIRNETKGFAIKLPLGRGF